MNCNKLTLLSLLVGAVLTGCASAPDAAYIAKQEAEAQQIRNNAWTQRVQKEQEGAISRIKHTPLWVINPPKSDEEGVFAVGMGESKKLDVALKIASLNAQFGLAKNYKQELSGSEQLYTLDNGNAGVTEQYKQLIDNLVDSVSVVGYRVVEQEIIAIDGKMNAYVLLKLPFDKFNATLGNEIIHSKNTQIKQAVEDLEERLKDRKRSNSQVQ